MGGFFMQSNIEKEIAILYFNKILWRNLIYETI